MESAPCQWDTNLEFTENISMFYLAIILSFSKATAVVFSAPVSLGFVCLAASTQPSNNG